MQGFLIINPDAGRGEIDAIVAAARAHDVHMHVLRSGEDAADVARSSDADMLGAAGGDGTLSSVAAVAVERNVPLVCVAAGTRNHFARDVGLDPDDLTAAVEAFKSGEERLVDVGRADGRVFLNNVSFGAYARLVHRREHHRRRREAFAYARALALALRRRQPVEVTLDGAPVTAPVIMVANNAYRVDALSVGSRDKLDGGLLHIYVLGGLLNGGWAERSAEKVVVDARPSRLRVAIDGNPGELSTPVELKIEPRALRLLVPRQPG